MTLGSLTKTIGFDRPINQLIVVRHALLNAINSSALSAAWDVATASASLHARRLIKKTTSNIKSEYLNLNKLLRI